MVYSKNSLLYPGRRVDDRTIELVVVVVTTAVVAVVAVVVVVIVVNVVHLKSSSAFGITDSYLLPVSCRRVLA